MHTNCNKTKKFKFLRKKIKNFNNDTSFELYTSKRNKKSPSLKKSEGIILHRQSLIDCFILLYLRSNKQIAIKRRNR